MLCGVLPANLAGDNINFVIKSVSMLKFYQLSLVWDLKYTGRPVHYHFPIVLTLSHNFQVLPNIPIDELN